MSLLIDEFKGKRVEVPRSLDYGNGKNPFEEFKAESKGFENDAEMKEYFENFYCKLG